MKLNAIVRDKSGEPIEVTIDSLSVDLSEHDNELIEALRNYIVKSGDPKALMVFDEAVEVSLCG